jgi:transcriptional activator SPT7
MSSRAGPSGPTTSIGQHSWLPPAHLAQSNKTFHPRDGTPTRSYTPSVFEDATMAEQPAIQYEGENGEEDEQQRAMFKELYKRSEAKIAALFGPGSADEAELGEDASAQISQLDDQIDTAEQAREQAPKKSARTIDEDNYDDEDDEDDIDEAQASPLKNKSTNVLLSPSKSGSSPLSSDVSPTKQSDQNKDDASQEQPKSSEDARKQLEEAKKATEEAAKRSFHTLFYTLENDRIAMLEQQKLEESEKQIDAEMDNSGNANSGDANGEHHGSLSSANLGASSLTLKHLIARIDLKREKVRASDAELRSLMNEVRKNRSKWASEENVHQEELYEAAEKVLSELKAMTEYSAPFLTRVNKRDAPDYYNSTYLTYMQQSPANNTSHQTPHGSWHYDQKTQDAVIQVEGRICC